MNPPAQQTPPRLPPRLRGLLLWLLVPLLSFLWFWLWRSNSWVGGDSEQWEREINLGLWFRKRQPFSFATLQLVNTVARELAGWFTRNSINLVSCLSGAFAMLIVWRMMSGRPRPWLGFAIVATAGFTTIFYGHIETYAQPVALLLLHLLAVLRVAERRWPPWSIAATFSLAMAWHLVILFALPATIIVLYQELRRYGFIRAEVLKIFFAFIPAIILWCAIYLFHFGYGELIGPHFSVTPAAFIQKPWSIFTQPMLPYKARFLFWNGGITGLIAIGIFIHALRRQNAQTDSLFIPHSAFRIPHFFHSLFFYFVCFIIFTIFWNPDAGDRDFDLFCFPWVIACLAVAWQVHALPWKPLLLGLIFGVNAYLWISRPAVFADLQYRQYGTILFDSAVPLDGALILLDEEYRVFPVNRRVPIGGHEITIRRPGFPLIRRTVNLRAKETIHLRLDRAGFKRVN